jgi:hypothetical protein
MTTEESKQDAILRKVRGLMAKAQSTEHEGERQVFMAKADQLMEQYAIETWMLESGKDPEHARLIETREFDMTWWTELEGVDWDSKANVWYLFETCVRHCRCYTSWTARDYKTETVKVYGMAADLDYLNLLFTDLFVQLFGKIKPAYQADMDMGYNVAKAKEAGMKYTDIAIWLGHPEWVVSNGTGGKKTADNGKMLREYKKYLSQTGRSPRDVISVNPKSYQYSFTSAFYTTISRRFREMSDDREVENSGGADLVLRDIRQMALEAFYDDFPAARPHASDCKCKICTGKKAPVRYRSGPSIVHAGYAAGGSAGQDARIASRGGKLSGTKQLNG